MNGGVFPGDIAIDLMLERLRMIGRTQESVARALGVSEKHISTIFNNACDPSFALARRMWDEIMNEPT